LRLKTALAARDNLAAFLKGCIDMAFLDRQKLYKSISDLRKRPIIAYVTSVRPNLTCPMTGDAISPIIEQIKQIPKDQKEIDFLIISNGGDPITALRIIGILRERFTRISVLLPYVAYSAATILSLGADEIIMHPFSNLGPVDPQMTVSRKNDNGVPEALNFSSEDLRNFIDFIKTDVGIKNPQQLLPAISPLLSDVGSLSIGNAKRSQQLSLRLSEKMLISHMKSKKKAKDIARALNSSYYHHGYAVSRKEALEIGLDVKYPDTILEDLLWNVWMDFSEEMKCNNSFDVIKELMSNPTSSNAITQVPIVNLPANTPPQIAEQIIINHAQSTPLTTRSTIQLKELLASIESVNVSKSVYTNIEILYWRNADMSLGFNIISSGTDWI
jgi:hypothetical protein